MIQMAWPITLHQARMAIVGYALTQNGGKRHKTARQLGVTVQSVRTWIRDFPELAHWRRLP